jgi:hypothetical protein
MKKLFLTLSLAALPAGAWAQIREFQTTRLNSTAGAGVASVLSTEAAILNPAASAYFEGSSASYQRYRTSLRSKNTLRDEQADPFADRNEHQGLFISDHSGPAKGGMAYLRQNENDYRRERVVLHGSAPMGPNASVGIAYNYIQDRLPEGPNRHQVHHQLRAGTTYIVDEETILGLVVVDPTLTTRGEERTIVGFQHNIGARLTLMADLGAQHTKDIKDKYLWRGALQVNVFSDFYVRGGRFYYNIRESRGMGWGASWIGPRLGIEVAQLISEQFGEANYIYRKERLVDTSISAIIKF